MNTLRFTGPGSAQPVRPRVLAFAVGDCLFLVLVAVTAAVVVLRVHLASQHEALAVLVGTALAMVAQVLMALAVAPVLGSIESMVPSMVTAMLSSMAACALMLARDLSLRSALIVGAAIGLGGFAFIQAYGWHCRARLRRLVERGPDDA